MILIQIQMSRPPPRLMMMMRGEAVDREGLEDGEILSRIRGNN